MRQILISFFTVLIFTGNSVSADWQVDTGSERQVLFESKTTLLDFNGTTNNIDGYIFWEGDSTLPVGSEFYFEVQPATFETGIGKRDRDMRSDVLHTDDYPLSSFKGKISKVKKSGERYDILAKGDFDLHGIKQKMEIPVIIEKKGNKMHVSSNFSIFLNDHNIEAPSLMAFVKVAEEIKLEIKFILKEVTNEK